MNFIYSEIMDVEVVPVQPEPPRIQNVVSFFSTGESIILEPEGGGCCFTVHPQFYEPLLLKGKHMGGVGFYDFSSINPSGIRDMEISLRQSKSQ